MIKRSGNREFSRSLKALGTWFERQKRVLPWRDKPELYRVWISEVMLQQTQVVTVVPYFERFLARFPTVEELARAPESEVMLHWAGLGYYSRARNLHRGAKAIVRAGRFPVTKEAWLEIPGVGPYTAGAIVSIALDQAEAILDGNVERVLSRVHAVGREKGDTLYKQKLWKLASLYVEEGARNGVRPSVLNQALMELGARVCTVKNPSCLLCPLEKRCIASRKKLQESYPPRKKKKAWVLVNEELHCVLRRKSPEAIEALLRRRAPGEWRAGLWDLLEEKPRLGRLKFLGSIESRHIVTRHKILRKTQVWSITGSAKAPRAAKSDEIAWVSIRRPELPVGSALRRTLQLLLERFPEAGQGN